MDGKTPWTKGPWFLEGGLEKGEPGWLSYFPPSGMPLFEMRPLLGPKERRVADARLIAAAPALAEALEEVMEWVNNWSPDFIGDQEWPETEAKIDAALSQARGGK